MGRVVADEHGEARGSRPETVTGAEQCGERLAQLLGAIRLRGEQGELPAVERLAEAVVAVGGREPVEQVGREPAAELVEPRGLAGRLRGGNRQHRPHAVGPPVEPFEQDGARGDRSRRPCPHSRRRR